MLVRIITKTFAMALLTVIALSLAQMLAEMIITEGGW